MLPLLLLLLAGVLPALATNGTAQADVTPSNGQLDITALFSDLSATDVALLVIVMAVILGILCILLRQGARNSARLMQIHDAENRYWQTRLDQQSIQLPPNQNTPTTTTTTPQADNSLQPNNAARTGELSYWRDTAQDLRAK